MKKIFILIFTALLFPNSTWQSIDSSIPKPMNMKLIESNIDNSTIKFSMDGFHLVPIENSTGFIIKSENGASILKEGYPNLQKITRSIIIPDDAKMSVNVVSSKYKDFNDIDIMPSKGNITRDINPNTVPFVYKEIYNKNEFFPNQICELGDPYILRDLRGQAVSINPFQYNAKTKVLRVYTEIIVEINSNGLSSLNTIDRSENSIKLALKNIGNENDEAIIFFTGSLYFAGEILNLN